MTNNIPSQRLASLDILRGFDLFLLLFLQPVLVSLNQAYHAPWFDALMKQFDHEVWQGFRFWDLIMPLFLFMVGTALPFSLSKYRKHASERPAAYRRIFKRFILLFLLGMIVQGNLLDFNFASLKIYNNTLQAIAVGYLISAFIILNCNVKCQIVATITLMLIYSIPMALYGSYDFGESLAFEVDRIIIGRFRGDLTYTWIWSSLNFTATVMLGAMAGQLIKYPKKYSRQQVAMILLIIGSALTVIGLILGEYEPIIKRLWTTSMTLFSGGLCFLLLSLFYWLIDCKGKSCGLYWLKIYGMNAITAYVIGEVINFRSIIISLTYGLQPILSDYYPTLLTFGNFLILFLLLQYMFQKNIFIKI